MRLLMIRYSEIVHVITMSLSVACSGSYVTTGCQAGLLSAADKPIPMHPGLMQGPTLCYYVDLEGWHMYCESNC